MGSREEQSQAWAEKGEDASLAEPGARWAALGDPQIRVCACEHTSVVCACASDLSLPTEEEDVAVRACVLCQSST